MKTVSDLILQLKTENIRVNLKGDDIELKGAKNASKELIDQVRTHKSEIVKFLKSTNNRSGEYINPAPVQESYPLSSSQYRLWVLCQRKEVNIGYNMPFDFPLSKDMDIEALEKSIDSVIKRHEILRTVFKEDADGNVRQWVKENMHIKIERVRTKNFRAYILEDSRKPLDLENGPLVRLALFELPDKYIFYCNLHHIIGDEWSDEVLMRDVMNFYDSYSKNEIPQIPDLRIQYKDFACYHENQLNSDEFRAHHNYWLNQLSGELVRLNLPVYKNRPLVKTYNGSSLQTYISKDVYVRLKEFSGKNGGSLFMGLIASFKALLYKYTGENDIIMGIPVTGRDHKDLEDQIGFYVNAVALRSQISEEDSFKQFFAKVQQTVLDAFSHQSYPFDKLVEDLHLETDIARSPVFDISLTFYKNSRLQEPIINTSYEIEDLGDISCKNDIELHLGEVDGNLFFRIIFNKDVYEQSTMISFMKHYSTLLSAMLKSPEEPLYKLTYLLKEEYDFLTNLNGPTLLNFENKTLVDLFLNEVKKSPEATAVFYDGRKLSYRELDERSNQLAFYLTQIVNIKKEEIIGIQLTRNEFYIVSLIGILKSGAAYLPIDPGSPSVRKKYILSDSNAKLLITDTNNLFDIDYFEGRIFAIDAEFDEQNWSRSPVNRIESSLNLAYVIYTSGSTGHPKGVMIDHKGIVNTIAYQVDYFQIGNQTKGLQFASFSFDASVWEIFLMLLSGSCLFMVDETTRKDPQLVESFIRDNNINFATLPPSFVELMNFENLSGLRTLITAGESAPHNKIGEYLNLTKGSYFNAYGPTETSICATVCKLTRKDFLKEQKISIGKAIQNTTVYILDRSLNYTPVGITGEIVVGGNGLSRGYLNNPELTCEKFIPNPFKEDELLYRTGDLGRWLPDGSLEFLGRKDMQVKIRGHRIEVTEIESAILTHPTISQVAVKVIANVSKNQELVAFIVYMNNEVTAEIRNYLSTILPDYMIPSRFIELEQLPTTSSGKIDYKSLIVPADAMDLKAMNAVSARSELEKDILQVWEKILQRKGFGIRDNFFSLGGDSIKAIQLTTNIKKELNVNVDVNCLYSNPTIEELANFLSHCSLPDEREDYKKGYELIEEFKEKIKSDPKWKEDEDNEDYYPLTPSELGMIYSSLIRQTEPVYYEQFIFNLRIENFDLFKQAFSEMIERHSIFRSKYYINSYQSPVKIIAKRIDLPLFLEDLSMLSEEEQKEKIDLHTRTLLSYRFEFEGELLWKIFFFKLSGADYLVVYHFHHAISDGWSFSVFNTELSNLMNRDGLTHLPPLKSSYKDYCAMILGRKNNPVIEDFWKKKLEGYSRNKLPFNFKGTKISDVTGMNIMDQDISAELLKKIEIQSIKMRVSEKSFFLAAHSYLLSILCSEQDIVTGVVTHDRPDIQDGEKIHGCFLGTLPMRINFSTVKDGRELLNLTQQYTIDVKRNSVHLTDVAKFIEEKSGENNLIFDTLFNYTHFHSYESWNENAAFSLVEPDHDMGFYNEMTNTMFDLEVDRRKNGVSVRIKYLKSYFDKSEIERALSLYERILRQFADDLTLSLTPVSLLSKKEIEDQLYAFNDTEISFSDTKSIHQLIEEQVKRSPNQLALIQGDVSMSYDQLNAKANKVSRYLIRNGVKVTDNVGLLVGRTFDMVIGMLAILKCGGAYVPIDPEYPEERQQYIIRNSGVKLVLQDAPYVLSDQMPDLIFKSMSDNQIEAMQDENVNLTIDPGQLAYTIYTSGSTGNPKGVMIPHRPVVNLLEWVNKRFDVGINDRLLFITSMCFDLSVYDVFGMLSSGGSLVIAKQEEIRDLEKLKELLAEQKITFWDSVPTTLNYLIEELERENENFLQNQLRLIFMSGDWIPVQLPDRIKKYFPNAEVISLGGATEGTVWSNYFPIDKVGSSWSSIPYGKPIANNFFYILNQNLEPVPHGVVGDLYIGGLGVARGYANDEQKTKAGFMKNPFSESFEGMMYKTGDLGRMLPDGNMEFLGRQDHQVKIRGFRVELGEIESALLKNERIAKTVVNYQNPGNGGKILVAYYVAGEEIPNEELRMFLGKYLPGYMVPSVFIKLDEIPLTSNGKVNRNALPGFESLGLNTQVDYIPPRNETEKKLVEIWQKVLNLTQVGIKDNFFEIGGHSLSGMKLLSKIQNEFEIKMKLEKIFLNPDVESLSAEVDRLILEDKALKDTNAIFEEFIL